MRITTTLLTATLLVAGPAAAADDYKTAEIIDAGQDTEIQSAGLFGNETRQANLNRIVVELDGMRYTAEWQTMFAGGRDAAGQFIVGGEVDAYVRKDKWLELRAEDGNKVRGRIIRREIVDNE